MSLPIVALAIATFLAAAKTSKNENLRTFAEGIWSAENADLYVDAKGGYPVAYRGSFSGIVSCVRRAGTSEKAVPQGERRHHCLH